MKEEIKMNEIYNEDCLETLKNMPDNFVNLTITSPPYNMNLRIRNGKYCSRQITKEFTTKYQGFNDNLPIEKYYNFHSSVLKELIRVSDLVFYNIAIVTGSKRAFFKMIGEFSDNLKEIIVWNKMQAQPSISEKTFNRQTELLLVFEKDGISRRFKKANFELGTMCDLWSISVPRNNKDLKENDIKHTAKFPEELVEKIIENFSKEKDVIYDPFLGTGTTAIVAKKMNRKFIGNEIVKKYYDYILTKIK